MPLYSNIIDIDINYKCDDVIMTLHLNSRSLFRNTIKSVTQVDFVESMNENVI